MSMQDLAGRVTRLGLSGSKYPHGMVLCCQQPWILIRATSGGCRTQTFQYQTRAFGCCEFRRRQAHIQAQIQFQAVRQVLHRDARDPRPQILNPNPKYDPKHHPKERSQSLSCETASLTPSGSLSLAQGRQRCVKLAFRAKVPKP